MLSIPLKILFGHILGDYVLQPRKMAEEKSKNSWTAALHTVIYTASICLAVFSLDWRFILVVFSSHFILDRFSIVSLWIKHVLDRDPIDMLSFGSSQNPTLRAIFGCIVYVVIDNGLHLFIAIIAAQLLL